MPDRPPPILDAALSDKLRRQLDAWRRQLIAVDRRQRQLYFKHTRTASLELIGPAPADLAILLSRPTRLCTLVPGPAAKEQNLAVDGPAAPDADTAADRYGRPVEGGIQVADKHPAELENSLRRLDVIARQLYADRGLWTLYAGLLMLQWVDPDDNATVVSPVLLVPVELTREARDRPYRVHRNQEDPVLNPTLRLKMSELGVQLPDIDADDPDLPGLRDIVTRAIDGRAGWAVLERSVLTTFSFQKEAMYRDLTDNAETILTNAHVQLLALGPDAPVSQQLAFDPPDLSTLDERYPAEELASILDADSSQRSCIVSARDGHSFVMDGPPGTGKSQTIANIIVELMAAGKTVLFVSEKAAALDVVRDRLSQADLGSFLFELHSHAATRRNVVDDLHRTLQQQVLTKALFSDGDRRLLVAMREQLTRHAAAMNEVREPLGRSVFGVLGELGALPTVTGSLPTSDFWARLDDATLRRIADHAQTLARNWRPAQLGEDFGWRDLADPNHTEHSIRQLISDVTQAAGSADGAVLIGSAVDDDTGLSLPTGLAGLDRRVRLLQLAERRPPVVDEWLFRADLRAVFDLVVARKSVGGRLIAARDELAGVVGPRWAELDDSGLDAVAGLRGLTWAPADSTDTVAAHGLLDFLDGAPARLGEIVEDAAALGCLLGLPDRGLTLGRTRAYADLALLAEQPAKPLPGWLNPAAQAAVGESVAVLGSLTDLVRRHEQNIREVFTDQALSLDLAALTTRFTREHRGWGRFSGQARADRRALKAVAVRGKVDRRLIERLPDAAAWQAATRDLIAREQQFAGPLGPTYRRLDTDFGRIGRALDTARRAVDLAGAAVDPAALARQLADGGAPDPGLTLIARRLAEHVAGWIRVTTGQLDQPAVRQIEHLSLEDAARWCAARSADLREPLAVAGRVAELGGRALTIAQTRSALAAARRRAECEQLLTSSRAEDAKVLGPAYAGADTDWAALDAALEWAGQVREVTGGPVSPATADRLSSLTLESGLLIAAIEDWRRSRDRVLAAFTDERARGLAVDLDLDLRQSGPALREMADTAYRDISEWCAFSRERAALAALHLGDAVAATATARMPAEEVAGAIEAGALRAWLDTTIERDERLRRYQAAERDALAAQYRELDRRIVHEAHTLVAATCGQRRPKSLTGRPAQVIIREANKKTRHKPIRQLLDEVGSLVTELKPCFMMSPLTVSMFLSPEMRFDAVIFDEASQVVPADAVNCIYRGGQLVVAGDQKQLPPTDFFARAEDADHDDAADDPALDTFQSVLDLCKAAGGLGSLPLTWHYRSRHEDLITYSNYRFYDGGLRTFPSASFESADLGVEHFLVDGRYRRSGARDNPVEARKVAELVAHHVHTRSGLSLGVVTFSTAQEDAVRGAIEASGQPEVVELLEDRDRLGGFFVKSLENVQGDERDVIIFSVGYGPDEHGKFTMNFGPLNREGGWRRLNVAITRARRRVEIVSSFRPAQITGVNSAGPLHLRGYLDFADRGAAALAHDAPASGGDAESVFEEQVAQVIRSWGYLVHTQVGAAGYRIDLAVLHPDRPGEHLLGVECDGAAYHSARTARDRDRLREQVLLGLGWRIHRIWGISWWRDRATQHARLRAAIDAAVEATAGAADRADPAAEQARREAARVEIRFDDIDPQAVPGWAVPYRVAGDPSEDRHADPRSPEARPALRRFFEAALRVEAPVHEAVLLARFRDSWGISRLGAQIRSNAEYVLSRVRVDGRAVHRDAAGVYRVDGAELTAVRVPTGRDGTRNVLSIPPEEIDLAVVGTVRDAIVIEQEQLVVAVARLFGWQRSGPDIQNAIIGSISRLIQKDRVRRNARREVRLSD
jgi:very-short-patch-repair endonuclease